MLTQKAMFFACSLMVASVMLLRSGADPMPGAAGVASPAIRYVPDEWVRQCVAGLDASQVASINFDRFWIEGHHAGLMLDEDNTSDEAVTDPKLIGKLLRALQHAQRDIPLGGGSFGNENPDQLKILLKPRGGITPPPILLRCDYTIPGSCFGPKFFAVMPDVEQYRAEQVRRFVRDRSAQIKSVTLGDSVPVGPTEKQRLIRALEQVDGRAFAFTSRDTKEFCPSLIMQDGKEEVVWFVFLPLTPGKHESPPLPPALWSAYLVSNKIRAPHVTK